jgi:uncharacterized protein YndB with AHSA1/START domain
MTATLQKIEPLVMQRQFAAPPARLYAAWTDASLFRQWFGPPGGSVTRCEFDAKVGGPWRFEMRGAEGATFGAGGVFKVLEPPKRIVLSWIWDDRPAGAPDMEIDSSLTPSGEGTAMTFRQTGFRSEEQRGRHTQGWTPAFDKLAALLAA